MDKRECANKLQGFVEEIQNLLDFLQHTPKSLGKKHQAQEMLKTFKERLKIAYQIRDKASAYERMTETEKAYFFPAVHEAFANLTITTNSNPSEKWELDLIDAQNTLNYYLNQLEDE